MQNQVQFDEQNYTNTTEKKSIVGFLIRKNIVSNKKQANIVLFIFMLLMIIVSIILLPNKNNTSDFNTSDYPYGVVSPEQT